MGSALWILCYSTARSRPAHLIEVQEVYSFQVEFFSKFKFIRSKLAFFFLVELALFIRQPPRLYLMRCWIFMFFDLYVSPLAPPDCVDDPPHHPSSYYYYLPAISKMKIPNKKVIL